MYVLLRHTCAQNDTLTSPFISLFSRQGTSRRVATRLSADRRWHGLFRLCRPLQTSATAGRPQTTYLGGLRDRSWPWLRPLLWHVLPALPALALLLRPPPPAPRQRPPPPTTPTTTPTTMRALAPTSSAYPIQAQNAESVGASRVSLEARARAWVAVHRSASIAHRHNVLYRD